ncbi:MAG: citrate (Si)-synthase [Chloroflexi bacterium]|jgi:citrate synthase|nr:citrate (Si)-synthase [Chloroflexota bacterium]
MKLAKNLEGKIREVYERVRYMLATSGETVISQVSLRQFFSGNRDVDLLLSDVSYVDPFYGLHYRGLSLEQVLQQLPKPQGSVFPYAGGLYSLLLTGEMPGEEEALEVEDLWKDRAAIPQHVINVLKAMPAETHPMTMFSQAILALQTQSQFTRDYSNGLSKEDYWKITLEDSLDLTAKAPGLAATIYNIKYGDGTLREIDSHLDWSANFAHLIYKDWDQHYQDLCRLFFVLHADQGTGNVSAHTACLVNSALSDVYYSCSAAMNGLAGPLHGRANQDCLQWLLGIMENFDGSLPTMSQLEQYVWDTLERGKVIPGYGHAVLRCTDPRFAAQLEFGKQYMADDQLFNLVEMVYQVVPDILKKQGKAKGIWPNVDAISGTLQYHCGVKEFDFYTVLFGVGRMLGITVNLVWNRALALPLERPQSITLQMVQDRLHDTLNISGLRSDSYL